jgi:hypothetical protein
MGLMIGIFNFCVESLGFVCLSDPINSGSSAGKTAAMATSTTSVGSLSEVNSLVNIKPTETRENTIEELDEIMENLDLKESSGYSDMAYKGNSDSASNYFEEDFMACYGNVSSNSDNTWRSGLELYDDKQTIFSSGSSHGINNQYQVYAIIDDTSQELDDNNNPIIIPENIRRGANHMVEGETAETMAARVKVQLTTT